MTTNHTNRIQKARQLAAAAAAATLTALVILTGTTVAHAAPVKLVLASTFGREVNLTQTLAKGGAGLEDICTVESKDECQTGRESSLPGGFVFPRSVAAAPNGDVYVADQGNGRVQELTSTGEFVLMFGREVDASTKGDLCTAASGDQCKAGVQGEAAGQLYAPESVAVDPATGDVYVAERVEQPGTSGKRVQEFTATGQFVLEIGREVNEKTKGNLCTQQEVDEKLGVKCTGAAQVSIGSAGPVEPGAFNFGLFGGEGDLLAVGGEHDLLYVGDESRVQEFEAATGAWKGEIPLQPAGDAVLALALDQETSDLYLEYGGPAPISTIEELNPKDEKINSFEVNPREKGATITLTFGLALGSQGDLAVSAVEEPGPRPFGILYDAGTGHPITEFTVPDSHGNIRLGFNGQGELFGAELNDQEVVAYQSEFVAELLTGSSSCAPGAGVESSVVLACILAGEVNPEGVPGTEAWFEWGRSEALGEATAKQKVQAAEVVHATIQARPNETFYYRLAAEDLNAKLPEELTGELAALVTPVVAPEVVGEPSASFVKDASAVMFAELNPENADTEYFFEYAAGEALAACPGAGASCPGVARTAGAHSAVYGRIPTTMEASGLQPDTSYHYRLVANNEHVVGGEVQGGEARGAEGTFTTAPAPVPSTETGAASAVSATGATVTGMVNPDGLPATYAFELGVYEGASTQYGVVFSGAAGTSIIPMKETLALTGLQPGTTYAYRIALSSGYVRNELHTLRGAPATFTTGGQASVLALPAQLAQLPVPNIAFPTANVARVKTSAKRSTRHTPTRAGRLAQALRACAKRPVAQRAGCKRTAHKRYPTKPVKSHRKR